MNLTDLGVSGVEESIAFLALILSFIAIGFSALTHRRESRVERSSAYLQLEVQSSQIFQFEADHCDEMAPFCAPKKPVPFKIRSKEKRQKTTDQLYFQSLNLFEVAANFRKKDVIDHAVFASWVAWFFELANDWYFQEFWERNRSNYTPDVRNIFDVGCQIVQSNLEEDKMKPAFYEAVAMTIERGGCDEILGWLAKCDDRANIQNVARAAIEKYKG